VAGGGRTLSQIIDPKANTMSQYLPIDRVAERYATTKFSIYRWLREQRDFPLPVVMPSGVKRWAVTDLEAWEAAHRAHPDDFA
jgi:predicted DNA-binding transcriptional regulator AlpA